MEDLKFNVMSQVVKSLVNSEEYLYEMNNVTIFCDISEQLTRQMFSDNEAIKEILMKSLTGRPEGIYNVQADCVIIFDLTNTEHNATFRVLHLDVEEVKPMLH